MGGPAEVWWAVWSAVAVGVLTAGYRQGRRFVRWLARRTKRAYKEWFAEAIDEHVQPQFEAIKANTKLQAAQIRSDALDAAAEVKEQLRLHTLEEGEVVRAVVREELGAMTGQLTDLQGTVTTHLALDERRFDEAHEALVSGQGVLVRQLQTIDASIKSAASVTDATVARALGDERNPQPPK